MTKFKISFRDLFEILNKTKNKDCSEFGIEESQLIYINERIKPILSEAELLILKSYSPEILIDIELLAWILFEEKRCFILSKLDNNFFQLNRKDQLNKVEDIISSNIDIEPLQKIPIKFYSAVSDYLKKSMIDQYPFNQKSRRFLKSISNNKYTSYSNYSEPQKDWLKSLINNSPNYFSNDFLREKGFNSECNIISENFIK